MMGSLPCSSAVSPQRTLVLVYMPLDSEIISMFRLTERFSRVDMVQEVMSLGNLPSS